MYYSFDIESQLRRIFKKFEQSSLINSVDIDHTDRITDFFDGEVYKRLLNGPYGQKFKNKDYLTLLLNTDGISKSSNSDLTIWPVYLAINELPSNERFCIENIIIAGLSVGYKKPDFATFMTPIMANIVSLQYGVQIQFKNKENSLKQFFLISAVFDKPARAAILNMKSSNSYDGCLKCYQTSVPLNESKN
jgi:hypothetical protein